MRSGRSDITRQDGLAAFSPCERAQQNATPGLPYPELLARVHGRIAESLGIGTDDTLDEAFAASIALWPAFPDTADALRLLKKHFRLVILSNVNRDGFAASSRKLGVAFDAVHTAEDIGSCKPADANVEPPILRSGLLEPVSGDLARHLSLAFENRVSGQPHDVVNAVSVAPIEHPVPAKPRVAPKHDANARPCLSQPFDQQR